jgi:predicted nucleotidyltransferase
MPAKNSQITELEDAMIQNNLFERFSLSRIGVFGSAARGEQSNDIDILIEDSVDYRLLSALRDELQRLMNKRIDIIIARYANPIVLHRAKKEVVYVTKR